MNASYLHLVFNHLPLFGALFGTTALVWGLLRANPGLKTAGLVFLLAASIGGWIAHITGEKSEHYVESLEGISRQAVHAHEEAAETTHLFVVPLGALVLLAFYLEKKSSRWTTLTLWSVAALGLATLITSVIAAESGGHIIHTEVHGSYVTVGDREHEAHEENED